MMRKRYPLNQSPLFLLQRREKLAELLKLPLGAVEGLANSNPPRYRCFERSSLQPDGSKKKRHIEWPYRELQRVQRRIAQLLDRIEPPEYLHSAFRGRSYVTNALQHQLDERLAKIDIRAFFPKSSGQRVFDCFRYAFGCSPDVAAVLTKLTTKDGHLPTGGSTSCILSFYAYQRMFDEIHALAKGRGIVMTCCVDDMTFTGEGATPGFLNEVRLIVGGYQLKTHKRRYFEAWQAKVVTGVVLTPRGVRLPNRRRRKLHETYLAMNDEADPVEKVSLGEELLGRATEAAQVEAKFRATVPWAARALNEAKSGWRASLSRGFRKV